MSSCIPLKVDGQAALLPLLDCLADIKAWLGANFLNLNESKTEAIVFGKISPAFYTDALGPLASNIRPSVKNLGVIFEKRLFPPENPSQGKSLPAPERPRESHPRLHNITTGLLQCSIHRH